jgi:DNA repair protein RadC
MTQLMTQRLFQVSEVELTYRTKIPYADRPVITESRNSYDILMELWDQNKIELLEEFKILLLDRRNAVLGFVPVSSGGISSCIIDPKILFVAALKARASSIVMAHNHPSGNLRPSKQDKDLTQKIKSAGLLLDISVLDHLIITRENYYSFADNGLVL